MCVEVCVCGGVRVEMCGGGGECWSGVCVGCVCGGVPFLLVPQWTPLGFSI